MGSHSPPPTTRALSSTRLFLTFFAFAIAFLALGDQTGRTVGFVLLVALVLYAATARARTISARSAQSPMHPVSDTSDRVSDTSDRQAQ
jgi:hypothetical protein